MDWKAYLADMNGALGALRKAIPETAAGFSSLARAADAPGALDEKTKELVALGISVRIQCDACIGFHVKALIRLGATRDEVAEAAGVAVYMGGGPGLMYAAKALQAYDALSAG